jgi:hypothetical protein
MSVKNRLFEFPEATNRGPAILCFQDHVRHAGIYYATCTLAYDGIVLISSMDVLQHAQVFTGMITL